MKACDFIAKYAISGTKMEYLLRYLGLFVLNKNGHTGFSHDVMFWGKNHEKRALALSLQKMNGE